MNPNTSTQGGQQTPANSDDNNGASFLKASPRPWRVAPLGDFGLVNIRPVDFGPPIAFTGSKRPNEENEANAALIVQAVNERCALLDELAALKGENAELEKVAEAAGVEIDGLTTERCALLERVKELEGALREIEAINSEPQSELRKRMGTRAGLSIVAACSALLASPPARPANQPDKKD